MRRSRIEKSLPVRAGCPTSRTWVGTDAKVVRHVHVCGDGQLAAATRLELERLGIQRETDYLLPSLRPALVIACADSEADQSFNYGAQQAVDEGSPLLLCCLAGRVVRLGPLIDPSGCFLTSELPQAPPDSYHPNAPDCDPWPAGSPLSANHQPAPAEAADARLTLHARLGALLISAQALNFLLGARNQCVLDRVVELDPWSMESKGYRVLPN